MSKLNKLLRWLNRNKLILITALFIGIILSYHNISYILKDSFDYDFHYIPIRWAEKAMSDDYFYYSHFREIIDGHFPYTDSDSFENKGTKSHYISYTLSYLMSAIGGIFTDKIEHAYYFNSFVFPILNFILMYYLCFLITRNKRYSLLISVAIILFSWYMQIDIFFISIERLIGLVKLKFSSPLGLQLGNFSRAPNIMFTNIVLFIFIISLYKLTIKYDLRWFVLSSVFLGFTSYTYFPICVVSFCIVITYLFISWSDKVLRQKLIFIIIIAIIISSYSFYWLLHGLIEQTPYYLDFSEATDTGFPKYYGKIDFIKSSLTHIINVFLFSLVYYRNYRNINTAILFGSIISLFSMQIIFGFNSHISNRMIYRGFLPLYMLIVFSILYHLWIDIFKNRKISLKLLNFSICDLNVNLSGNVKSAIKNIRKQKSRISLCIITCLFATALFIQIRTNDRLQTGYNDQKSMIKLFDWLQNNTEKDDVVLTLDSELLLLLPVFTHLNLYIPNRLRSVTAKTERMERLYEGMKYLNITPVAFKYILSNMESHYELQNNNVEQINLNLFNLVIFYRQYLSTEITEEEIEKLISEYKKVYNKNGSNFTYKIDYIIISKYNSIISKKFNIKKMFDSNNLLFKSDWFSVYDLVNNRSSR